MTSPDTCRECRLFVHDAHELERALPGLNILSSALGSVRADTGLCKASDTLIMPQPACPHFCAAKPGST
ncbi:MAG: hypothetical protein PHY45_04450 [Rhodocyclaceae bacterium]|nr:hypothetical protein [Rhodocyclaceae bacterium]